MSEATSPFPRCHGQTVPPATAPWPGCPDDRQPLPAGTPSPRVSRGRSLPFRVAVLLPGFLFLLGASISNSSSFEFALGICLAAWLTLPVTCCYCAWWLSKKRPRTLPARIAFMVILTGCFAIINLAIGAFARAMFVR